MAWKVIGASAPGTLHQKRGTNCQDAYRFEVLPNGYLIVAVADGAGSALNARQGAELAVSTLVSVLHQSLASDQPQSKMMIGETIKAAFTGTHHALTVFAKRNGQPLSSYATTLACAVVADDFLGIGHLGDAVLVVKTGSGRLKLMNEPQRGEYANDSYFITMNKALDYCHCEVYTEYVESIALTTDGLLRLALRLPTYQPFPDFFKPLFNFVKQSDDLAEAEYELKQFLLSDPVNRRTDDDKTLVLATRVTRTHQSISQKCSSTGERKVGDA